MLLLFTEAATGVTPAALTEAVSLAELLQPALVGAGPDLRADVTRLLATGLPGRPYGPFLGEMELSPADALILGEALRRTTGRSWPEALGLAEALLAIPLGPVVLPILETWDVPGDTPGELSGLFPWLLLYGTGAWGRIAQAAQLQGTGASSPAQIGLLNRDMGRSDLRVTATIEEWHDTGSGFLVAGPMFRMPGPVPPGGGPTGYSPILLSVDGVATASLQRFVNGVQVQIGPAVSVAPHPGIRIGVQGEGDLLGLYVDDVRQFSLNDPVGGGGLLTGRYIGLNGVASGTNRVRVTSLGAALPAAAVATAVGDAPTLTETLRRAVAHGVPETLDLSEALTHFLVSQRALTDAPVLTELLAHAKTTVRSVAEPLSLYEALGIDLRSEMPHVRAALGLTETLAARVSGRAAAEALALSEALGRVFRAVMRVGVLQITNEQMLVSGTEHRRRVSAAGLCPHPIPEQTGFEYTADLRGRDGIIVTPAELNSLQVSLYNLADLTTINGIARQNALNVGKGSLDGTGHLTITADAADVPIVDQTKTHEHHVLLVEGTYDGGVRAFRRAVEHVVTNLAKVP